MRYRSILSEYASAWELLFRLSDAGALVVAGWAAGWFYLGTLPDQRGYVLALVLAVLLALVVFPAFGLYRTWRGAALIREIRALTLAWGATFGGLTFLAFVTKSGPEFSRIWFLVWAGLAWLLLLAGRVALRTLQRALRQRGYNLRSVALVGTPAMIAELSARLHEAPWTGLTVRATFDAAQLERDGYDGLAERVRADHLEQVWVAVPLHDERVLLGVQEALRFSTVDLRYVPDVSAFALLNHSVSEVAGIPVINLSTAAMSRGDRLVKATFDRVLALLIVLAGAPLFLAIAAGVKLDSPGPVLFRQRRLGLGGEAITVLKFRSMVVHAEPAGQVTQARPGDPRVTRFGAFLRRTSLDELPQFFNVLRGEMSIVGPRPHAIEHDEHYRRLVSQYMARLKIKPGITGWAQVNGLRGETDTLEKMRQRIEHDLHYIENWSLGLDISIIARTILHVLRPVNAF